MTNAYRSPVSQFVPTYAFRREDKITINGIEYRYDRADSEGHLFRRSDGLSLTEAFSHAQIYELMAVDKISVLPDWYDSGRAAARLKTGGKPFGDLPFLKARKAHFQWTLCERFLGLEAAERQVTRSDPRMEPAIARIMGELFREAEERAKAKRAASPLERLLKGPAPTTLRRWLRDYAEGGFTPDAFIDKRRGPGPRQILNAEEYELHLKHAMGYASRDKPSKALLYLNLRAEVDKLNQERAATGLPPLRILGRRAFEKMIDKLDPYGVCLGREGSEAARRKFGASNGGLSVERPLQRVEIDEWKVTLQTILCDAGVWRQLTPEARRAVQRSRLWVSVAIDVRTRVIVAMRFIKGDPTSASAVATLEMVVLDKAHIAQVVGAATPFVHGTPEQIATDSGSSWASYDFQSRVLQIGAQSVQPPSGLAEMRARIERVFLTLQTKIAARFSGQTFANIIEKGDYDSEANAVLDVEELNRVFVRGVLDIYHNSPHVELGGETPMNCWLRLSSEFGVRPPPCKDIRRHVFGIRHESRIGPEGVRFAGIRYQSKEVQMLRRRVGQKPVEIRVDRFDLSTVSVRDGSGWLTVFARYEGLENVSYWEWREAVRDFLARNAATTTASQPILLKAVRDLDASAEMALKRAELGSPILSAEQFRKDNRELFRHLPDWRDHNGAVEEGADLDEALGLNCDATGEPTGGELPTAPESESSRDTKRRIENRNVDTRDIDRSNIDRSYVEDDHRDEGIYEEDAYGDEHDWVAE